MPSRHRRARIVGVVAFVVLGPLAPPRSTRADDWSITRPNAAQGGRARRSPAKVVPRADPARPAKDGRDALIARYRAILGKDPFHAFAFDRLVALVRERDGGLDALARELEGAEDAARDEYAHVVLRGRVAEARLDRDGAVAAFARATALDPGTPAPYLALADLAQARGDAAAVRDALGAALARATTGASRGEIVRRLAALALDRGDFEDAERRYAELARLDGGAGPASREHARALAERGESARAVLAYQQALEALRADTRAAAQVRIDLARLHLAARDPDAALEALSQARVAIARGTGIARELDELAIEAHRTKGTLAEFVAERSAEPRAPDTDALLARVYEEMGDHAAALAALAALERILSRRPGAVDARSQAIRLLAREGRLEEALGHYRRLVLVARGEPRFAVEMAELLMRMGRRAEAIKALAEVSRRHPRATQVHRALSELYSRWGETALATAEVEVLARLEPREPMHWVMLGEQALAAGDRERAMANWRRIVQVAGASSRAHTTLGEVFLDHDMPAEAIEAFTRALALSEDDVDALRGFADASERLNRRKEAIDAWRRVLALAASDRVVAREARRRMVRLWLQTGEAHARLAEYERAFGWSPSTGARDPSAPGDLEAGRLLAEAYPIVGRGLRGVRVDPRYTRAAEAVLERILRFERGDVESLLALQRLREARGDAAGAIEVLERLVEADPRNGRGYLSRLADHALALYRDADAVRYAERAVGLAPEDAAVHARLGDLVRARQDSPRAEASYRRALELDPTLYRIHFALAELCLARGESGQAQAHLRDVVRIAPDDEVVQRAAHWAVQLAQGSDGLEALERDLLPLALGAPGRPLHRRLLIGLYDVMTRGWVSDARGSDKRATEAREALRGVGRRAIKPLLEVLAEPDPFSRRVAVTLLGYTGDPNAALALLVAAESDGEIGVRRDALIAAGRLGSEPLAGRLAAFAEAPERRLRDAGVWGLAQLRGEYALSLLRGLTSSVDPVVRGYALLGLARASDAETGDLARRLLRSDGHAWVRASAAVALGWLRDRNDMPRLEESLAMDVPEVAALAAVALGMQQAPGAAPALADAAFGADPAVRDAALRGLSWAGSREAAPDRRALPEPDSDPSLAALVSHEMPALPGDVDASLARHVPELARAVRAALGGERARAAHALAWLAQGPPEPWPGAARTESLRRELTISVAERISVLARAADPALRVGAIRLYGALALPASASLVAEGLDDREGAVRAATLEALAAGVDGVPVAERVVAIATRDPSWPMRLRAVRVLARIGTPPAVACLARVVRGDPYAYVREEAVTALARLGRGREALRVAARGDREPRVRRAALRALRSVEGARGASPGPRRLVGERD